MAASRQAKSLPTTNRRGLFIEWRWIKIIVAALAIALLVAALFLFFQAISPSRGSRLLVEALSKRRLIEPRLSGGFKAGTFDSTSNDRTGIDEVSLRQAEAFFVAAVSDSAPQSQLEYGRFLTATGSFKEALKPLRKAVAGMAGKAEPHNDLGVCLMQQEKPEDALDEFNTALGIKANMPEALFNRALCYDRLLLKEPAEKDYSRLLTIERDSGWLEEIKRRQQEAANPTKPQKKDAETVIAFDAALASGDEAGAKEILSKRLDPLIKHAAFDCGPAYLTAAISGKEQDAQALLQEMRMVGRELRDINGDTSILDLADHLASLSSQGRQTEDQLIKEFKHCETAPKSQARPLFEKLSEQFATQKNHLFEFYCNIYCANCDFASGDYASSLSLLKQALAVARGNNWPYRLALTYNQLANVHSRLGLDSLALRYCDQALEEGRSMHSSIAKTFQFRANAYYNIRDYDNALINLRRSTIEFISGFPTAPDLASNFENIAEYYSLLGRHPLARLYALAALPFSSGPDGERRLARTRSFLAVELASLNQFDEARNQLNEAFACLEKIEIRQRPFIEATLWMRKGKIEKMANDLPEALKSFSQAEAAIENSQDKELLPGILRERAEVYLQAGQYDLASQSLEQASTKIQEYRARIIDRNNRSKFLDQSQSIYDERILLNIRAFSNWTEAFNLSEQSRARALLDDFSSRPAATSRADAAMTKKQTSASMASPDMASPGVENPLTLSETQQKLPGDLRIISYTVTEKGAFIFSITHDEFKWAESEATTETLDQLAQEFVSGIKSRENLDTLKEKGRRLYRLLIGPIKDQLNDGKRLVFIPDKALHYLPFAALVDESDNFFVKSHQISYAPSASVFVKCITEAQGKSASEFEKIFAVGNPLFNQEKFTELKLLPDAEKEANQSAGLYDQRYVLLRQNATKRNVLDRLADCDVAHFSLHCLLQEKSPALVLARDAGAVKGSSANRSDESSGDGDLLYLNEIYGISLPRTKLVILSACQSGLGQYYRGEGMVSLVRPFLALKIPTVVASLWSVDSQATAALMIDFHKGRRSAYRQAGDALRAAQVKMSESDSFRHPYFWAPFIVVGFDR
jgi:CHAT domain-containing protein